MCFICLQARNMTTKNIKSKESYVNIIPRYICKKNVCSNNVTTKNKKQQQWWSIYIDIWKLYHMGSVCQFVTQLTDKTLDAHSEWAFMLGPPWFLSLDLCCYLIVSGHYSWQTAMCKQDKTMLLLLMEGVHVLPTIPHPFNTPWPISVYRPAARTTLSPSDNQESVFICSSREPLL